MNAKRFLLVLLLLGIGSSVLAQTACPQGVAPGSPQCGPSAPGVGAAGAAAPSQPTARWKLTWGAFASDDTIGIAGTSTGERSKGAARRAALEKCSSLGGRECKFVLAYHHQCAVAAHPVDSDKKPEAGKTFYQAGPSIDAIQELAVRKCNEMNEGKRCEVLYANCTKPYLVHD